MRAGGVRARGDDGEVGALVPAVEHALDELAVHVELGAARERARRASSRAIASTAARRGAQRLDLGRVLHHAQRAGDVGRAAEARRRAARAGGRARSGPRCGRRSRPWSRCADRARRRSRSGRRSRPTGGPRTRRAARRRAAPRAAGTTSTASPSARQHQHREPLERHRLVAGEVRQVGAGREQQHVDAELAQSALAREPTSRRRSGPSRSARRCSSRSCSPGTRRGLPRPGRRPVEQPVAIVDVLHQRHAVPTRRRDAIARPPRSRPGRREQLRERGANSVGRASYRFPHEPAGALEPA